MIIYEVRLDVDPEIADSFRDWLGAHVREILTLPGFTGANIYSEQRVAGRVGWCVHYRLRDPKALEDYLSEHAPRLRAEGLARFPGRFVGERRALVLDESLTTP